MRCPYCGMETGNSRPHPTQAACRDALRLRLTELRKDLDGVHEMKLSGVGDAQGELDRLLAEAETVCERLSSLYRMSRALTRARWMGTKAAWDDFMKTVEEWASKT